MTYQPIAAFIKRAAQKSEVNLKESVRRIRSRLRPPPKLKVSQWADTKRKLAVESSAEPGQFRTSRTPHTREVMDAFNDPTITDIVVMFPTQDGKTESALNMIGYVIDQDPGPILYILPSQDQAKNWSKERLEPMIRETDCLREKVSEEKSRSAKNTITQKTFPGGYLALIGANAPGPLASRPIRVLFADEVDKYPPSAGREGDPIALAKRRTKTFWNKKHYYSCSPTIKGFSKIEKLYLNSDKRKRWIPCHECGAFQVLKWAQVHLAEPENPASARYICEHCKHPWTNGDRLRNLQHGEWRAEGKKGRVAGFWINGIYSTFQTIEEMVVEAQEAKKDIEEYKTWVNTFLCETFDQMGIVLQPSEVAARVENYGPKLPREVLLITIGVDVQGDRIEAKVKGWGLEEESWAIEYRQMIGNPLQRQVWDQLEKFLREKWEHESGIYMTPAFTLIDSGNWAQQVYKFVKGKEGRRIYAVKGANTLGMPIIQRLRKTKKGNVHVLRVGTDSAKVEIYNRLMIEKPGPGYMHFPNRKEAGFDDEYFRQLTAEKAVLKRRGGTFVRIWEKTRERNEALDTEVYSTAAFHALDPDLESYRKALEKMILENEKAQEPPEEDEEGAGKKKVQKSYQPGYFKKPFNPWGRGF